MEYPKMSRGTYVTRNIKILETKQYLVNSYVDIFCDGQAELRMMVYFLLGNLQQKNGKLY